MSCPDITDFKKGQTFVGVAVYTPETGWPADLSGVTIQTALRDQRTHLHYFNVTVDSPTQFTARSDETEKWAPGTAYMDIKFSQGDVVFYSSTHLLNIIPNVTPNKS
jgi:hypothetical protein